MSHWLSARTRLAAGLVAILGCAMLIAITIGLVPDPLNLRRRHRAELCESLAIQFSVLANRSDINGIRQSLDKVVKRHSDIRSAGVRDRFGRMIVDVNKHDLTWPKQASMVVADRHVRVPVFRGQSRYADVELHFDPLEASGLKGWLTHPWTLMMLFVNSVAFLLFWVYLGFMLHQLNPSKAVPSHVRRALNNLTEGLMVLDVKGRVVLVNSAFEQIVGLPEARLLGKRPKSLSWRRDGGAAAGEFPWDAARSTGQPIINTVLSLDAANGGHRVFNINCAPISTGGKENAFGVMVSLEDITQIDEARIQIQKSRDEAEAANRAKSEFLANMSHEIRTPMNSILGFTELLRRGMADSPADFNEYLATIHTSGSHLLELINDILDLSKIESGKMEMERIACSPFKLMTDVLGILKIRAKDKGLTLKIDPASRLPMEITTDPVRLRQVLTNLVGNAIKFTERGSVTISGQVDGQGQLEFRVRDTGIGISTAEIDRIFDPFAQADSSVTRRFGGTGLGLSISRRIARALGGELTVESEVGQGSTFIVRIGTEAFVQDTLIDYEQFQAAASEESSDPRRSLKRFDGQRVLAVDDGEANLRLISLVLTKANLQVDVARNGQEAIDKVLAQTYAMIFMDMQMPVLDGYTATRRLREAGSTIPIVALTAQALRGDDLRCVEAGCNAYMTKPIDLDRLLETVGRFIPYTTVEAPGDSADAVTPRLVGTNDPLGVAAPDRLVRRIELRKGAKSTLGVQLVKPETTRPARHKIYSQLALSRDEVAEIVRDFQRELNDRLATIQKCLDDRDWENLAREAHWLKGAGGTVGFAEFVEPSLGLEKLARVERDATTASQYVAELRELAASIDSGSNRCL